MRWRALGPSVTNGHRSGRGVDVPLPEPSSRSAIHHRQIDIRGYRRDDGLWDIEGHLSDRRSVPLEFPDGTRAAGSPIHSMWVRLSVDSTALIVAVCAATDASPYIGVCDVIVPNYERLVGLRVGPGFRGHVRRLFTGIRGCTHLSELVGTMATGVIQTLAGEGWDSKERKPMQLDGCHALQSSGPVVAQYYPKWYRKASQPE